MYIMSDGWREQRGGNAKETPTRSRIVGAVTSFRFFQEIFPIQIVQRFFPPPPDVHIARRANRDNVRVVVEHFEGQRAVVLARRVLVKVQRRQFLDRQSAPGDRIGAVLFDEGHNVAACVRADHMVKRFCSDVFWLVVAPVDPPPPRVVIQRSRARARRDIVTKHTQRKTQTEEDTMSDRAKYLPDAR